MDEADLGNQQAEMLLNASLLMRKPTAPPAKGRCLNCDEPLPAGQRWCDNDCLIDWEKVDRANKNKV